MASTAISAQGSTLQIGTGSGGAKTISAITVGFPTILTSAAHGLGNGDVVALAAFAGANAATLNGLSVVVLYKTANTIAVAVDTTGLTITAGSATATPVAFTKVGNWKSYNGFDGQPSEIDVSNMDSTAKEYLMGLVDSGQVQMELDQDNSDAGQAAMLIAYNTPTPPKKTFKITFPNASTATFTAYVKQFSSAGGVDQVLKRQATLRISGSVTWA